MLGKGPSEPQRWSAVHRGAIQLVDSTFRCSIRSGFSFPIDPKVFVLRFSRLPVSMAAWAENFRQIQQQKRMTLPRMMKVNTPYNHGGVPGKKEARIILISTSFPRYKLQHSTISLPIFVFLSLQYYSLRSDQYYYPQKPRNPSSLILKSIQ